MNLFLDELIAMITKVFVARMIDGFLATNAYEARTDFITRLTVKKILTRRSDGYNYFAAVRKLRLIKWCV